MQLQMFALSLLLLMTRTGRNISLLLQITVAVHEAVNTTGSINKLALTCIEWV